MKTTKIKNKMLENFLAKFKKKENKQSISFVEIPAQYETELFRIAQDRYHIVKEVNELCGENGDIRFQRANALIGEDATKGGFSIIVNGSQKEKNIKKQKGKIQNDVNDESEKVQKIVDDFLERTRLHILCTEHARALLRDGDLFLNVIVDKKSGLITEIKRAPTLTMKKNVDEYGNFIDNKKAFSQIDVSQIYQMAGENAPEGSRKDFALYQINHIRWLCDETKIYGTSQYAVARKCYKMLFKMEEALAYRRIYRSVSKRSHKLETTDIAEIEDYKRANAMVDEHGNPTTNAHMLTDYIGNVEVNALHDEANLDEIKDVEMIENMLWINLLVPKAIITGGQGINRDVLKVQYPHYLQTLENITDRLEYGDNNIYSGYRAIIDLQLLLLGINPENIYYDIVWSRKTEESTAERVESIQNALGKSGGKQLISHEKAIQLIADDFDIEDPSVMYQKVLEENGIKQNQQNQQNENNQEEQKDLKKKNMTSDAEALTDEHKQDFDEIERLSKEFTQKWKSFFRGIWEDVKQSSAENIESNIKKAWQKHQKGFYIEYIKKAYDLGEKRAQSITEQVLQDDILPPENGIGIEREDIQQELLNNALSRVSKMEQSTIEDVRKILVKGHEQGENWKEQKKKIENRIKNPVRAEMIAITELGHAYNTSTKNTYRQAGANKVAWHASIDIKTCDICRTLHGQVFDIDNAPDNPAHPRCRCTWLPVFSENGNFDNSHNIKYNNSEKQNVLTEQEERAIKSYISSESYKINDKLRHNITLTQKEQNMVENLDNALEKMPKYKGIISRSVDLEGEQLNEFLERHKINNMISYNSYTSFTKGEIYNPMAKIQIYTYSKNGYNIVRFNKGEEEILYQRNSKFFVKRIKEKDGIYYIILNEVN
ncbi:MAG: minor capsid protein [Firmicutes bacterium]|nr:minor capsid protein [Bacillota bacterium]